MNKHTDSGFTLIELISALSIAFIVITVAVPNFRETMLRNKTVSATNQMVRALNLARSEAIKRGVQVTIKPKGTNWESGWTVFTDQDPKGSFEDNGDSTLCEDGEDCLIRSFEGPDSNLTIRAESNYGSWFSYLPSGISRGSGNGPNGSFRVCRSDENIKTSRWIRINNTGRVKTQVEAPTCP